MSPEGENVEKDIISTWNQTVATVLILAEIDYKLNIVRNDKVVSHLLGKRYNSKHTHQAPVYPTS